MNLGKVTSALCLSASLSLPSMATDLINLKELPEWIQTASAREATVAQRGKVAIEQFNVDGEVIGEVVHAEGEDGTWYYNFNIGTASPVECYVFTEFDGAANSLHSIIEYSLSGAETLNKKELTDKFNFAVDSGVIGDTPYLLLDTLYKLSDGKAPVLGTLKGLAARTNDTLQVCVHNEMGYRSTFFEVFESFVNLFTKTEAQPEFFEMVHQITLNGMAVGYAREKYSVDSDNDVHQLTDTAFLIPVDANNVMRSDTVNDGWSRQDGSLINGYELNIENGELASEFSIEFKDESWLVSGQMQGKEVNSTLEYNGWLLSSIGSYRAAAELLASDETSAEYQLWTSQADPTSAMKIVVSKLTDDNNANIKVDMGPMVLKYHSDEQGVMHNGVVMQGGMELGFAPLYSKGTPQP